MTANNKPKNIYGKKYGRLTVIGSTPDRSIVGFPQWLCRCDCGKELYVKSHYLYTGHTKSCGCLKIDSRKKKDGISGLNAVL